MRCVVDVVGSSVATSVGVALALGIACGGSAESIGRSRGVPDGLAGETSDGDAAAPAPSVPGTALPEPGPAGKPSPFDDPGCPEASEAVDARTCDPFAEENSCPLGWDCFPYVEYPTDPCGSEVYGTRCEPSGTGAQGDPCEAAPCARGYLCVASGQGTVCAQLCDLPAGDHSCPAGLICGSVDIKGYGVCF